MKLENKRTLKERIMEKLGSSWKRTNKRILPLAGSFALGAGLGAIGKSTGEHFIPAVPPTMDLIFGNCDNLLKFEFLFYLAGVGLNYTSEIYLYF